MTTHDILKILQEEIHTVIMASVDDRGIPYTCAIDLMLLEEETLYFLTARGKSFYEIAIEDIVSSPFKPDESSQHCFNRLKR